MAQQSRSSRSKRPDPRTCSREELEQRLTDGLNWLTARVRGHRTPEDAEKDTEYQRQLRLWKDNLLRVYEERFADLPVPQVTITIAERLA